MQNKINRLYSDLKSFEQELLIQIKESSVALAMQVLDKVEPAQTTPSDEEPPSQNYFYKLFVITSFAGVFERGITYDCIRYCEYQNGEPHK